MSREEGEAVSSSLGQRLACSLGKIAIGIVFMNAARAEWCPVVMEEKPGAFEAQWIGPGLELRSDAAGQAFYVRRVVDVKDPASFGRTCVTADSQYVLYVNGREAFRGPARFDPMHEAYDTLDLSGAVQPGENVIAALVLFWGLETNRIPYFQCSMKPAFLFDSPELKSDGQWRTLVSPAHAGGGEEGTRGHGAAFWYERVDGRGVPLGFEQGGFDDSAWRAAEVICRAEKWGERGDTYTPWKLYPRRIPAPERHAPAACAVVQTGVVRGNAAAPPFGYLVRPEEDAAAALPLVFPADGETHYAVLDAGRLVNGFVTVSLEGAAGDAVEVMYAEAPSKNRKKDRRDALDGAWIEGASDVYTLREGRQDYQPFLHRTFRFIRIAARPSAPLTLHLLAYDWTGYPFPERGKFRCSDERLNRIWDVGWYTQRMCAFDTYQDCPFYERLQYGGDTRIQVLVTFYASGDPLLPANAIRQLQASAIPEGLVQSRYPNHVFQVIPGYSLCWIQMLDDYNRHTGDTALVRECAHTVASILRFYEQHKTGQGFIADLPYWNFYDWTYEKSGVPGAHAENCTLSTMHYKGCLDIAARLFDLIGDPLTAQRCREESARVTDALERAWDEDAGLYRDGIATRTFSQHVNVFAVLFGIADDARRARIAERLFTDPALRGTTFYFAHYLHEAAEMLGRQEYVIHDLDRWQHMLDLGATTWWETPDEPRSECHAWSATPTYRLMEMVLGVKPVAPGFAEVLVQPWPGALAWAEGTVPTPHGDIALRWENGERFVLQATLPEGVRGTAVLPDGSRHELNPGANRCGG